MINQLTYGMKVNYGKKALTVYQNEMVERYEDYKLDLPALTMLVQERDPDFLEYLGMAVATANLGQRRLEEAMERVAENSSAEKIPSFSVFSKGIQDELTDFDWAILGDAALDVAKDISQKGSEVAKDLGEGVGNFGSFLGKNFTIIAVVVLGILSLGAFKYLKGSAP